MKLEQQVTSLKLSVRLKELGVKQDSLFYWIEREAWYLVYRGKYTEEYYINCVSAFTSAELGVMLPTNINENIIFMARGPNHSTCIGYVPHHADFIYDEKEADARAKMLIHLIENNLVTV